MSGKAISMCKK